MVGQTDIARQHQWQQRRWQSKPRQVGPDMRRHAGQHSAHLSPCMALRSPHGNTILRSWHCCRRLQAGERWGCVVSGRRWRQAAAAVPRHPLHPQAFCASELASVLPRSSKRPAPVMCCSSAPRAAWHTPQSLGGPRSSVPESLDIGVAVCRAERSAERLTRAAASGRA